MKKIIAMALALTMALSLFAGCGAEKTPATEAPSQNAVTVEGTMEELLNKMVEQNPVEFMGAVTPVNLEDTSEDGLYFLEYYTGLKSAETLAEAAAFEPMMSSIAFSLVMARGAEGADTKAVAESMKAGINPRKWFCVEADDLMVCGYGDVVMLIMVSSDSGLTAQSYVDAFKTVVGGEPAFVI